METKSRPRRNIVRPIFDYTVVKEEEWALRRALYASLRQSAVKSIPTVRKRKIQQRTQSDSSNNVSSKPFLKTKETAPTRKSARIISTSNEPSQNTLPEKNTGTTSNQNKRMKLLAKKRQESIRRIKTRSHYQKKKQERENMQKVRSARSTSAVFSNSSQNTENNEKGKLKIKSKRARGGRERTADKNEDDNQDPKKKAKKEKVEKLMLAQRKFASSQPCSPSSLLLKQIATPLSERPKTEDFIKFLCLRGTPALPKELEFLNNPCMPPSPLSSDEEEPQYPVSPFFRRQLPSTRSSPFKDTPVKTERQISDSSTETGSQKSQVFFPPKIAESHQQCNGTQRLATPTPKLLKTPSPSSEPPLLLKSSSLKRSLKFTSKEDESPPQDRKTAFTRVSQPKTRQQSRKETLSPPEHFQKHTKTQSPPASKSGSTPSPPISKKEDFPEEKDLPLLITTTPDKPYRTVILNDGSPDKKKSPKKSAQKSLLADFSENCSTIGNSIAKRHGRRGSTTSEINSGLETFGVVCLYNDSCSPDSNKRLRKNISEEKEMIEEPSTKDEKRKSKRGSKGNKLKAFNDVGLLNSETKRSIKDVDGTLVVSLSTSDHNVDTSEKVQSPLTKERKGHVKTKVNVNCIFEKVIPKGHILRPMEQEFKDPVKFLKKIEPSISKTGMCCVIPPGVWRSSTVINEDIRFNTKMQHIHRMRHRFGHSAKKLAVIKKYHEEVSVTMENLPQIGSCEVDLVKISEAMHLFGGLQQVNNARKWLKLADYLRIPKNAHGRVNRLQDIYLKYVFPYDSLPEEKKHTLQMEVDEICKEKLKDFSQEDIESKGKSTSLAQFHRIACSTQEMYANKNDTTSTLEDKFWTIVGEGDRHVASPIGEIDAVNCGPAFQVTKTKSGWNLSNLPLASASALHGLGSISGITTPTIKFGGIFSTSGWQKREESFHSVEYLHAGASRVWYAIPAEYEGSFLCCLAKKERQDGYIHDKPRPKYLLSPKEFLDQGIPVTRIVQSEGEFVFIMPNVYHCVVNTGYCCSESVNFAPLTWLLTHKESKLFPVEKLVMYLVKEEGEKAKCSEHAELLLRRFQELKSNSLKILRAFKAVGIKSGESQEVLANISVSKQRKNIVDWQECTDCGKPCYLILVNFGSSSRVLCPTHAVKEASARKSSLSDMESFTQFSESEWEQMEIKLKCKIEDKEGQDKPVSV